MDEEWKEGSQLLMKLIKMDISTGEKRSMVSNLNI
jgi:hypothetical protein